MKIEFVIDDILDELSLLDENEVETIVVISVADLQLLPKVMPEETLAISVVERLSILEEEIKEIKNGIFSNCPATRPKGEQQPQSKLQRSMQPPQNQRVTFGKAFEVSYSSITGTERFFRILDLQKSCPGTREHNPLSKTSHYTNMAEMVSGYNDEPFKEPRRKQRNKEGTAGAQASGGASKENCLLGGNETICIQLTNVNPKVTEASINDHVTLQGIDVCKVKVSDTSTDGWLTKRFQVTFPRDMTERVLSTDFWPPKVLFREFFAPKPKGYGGAFNQRLQSRYVNSSFRMNLIGKSGMDPDVIRCGPSGGLAIITKESSKLSLSRIACSDEYEEVLAELESIVDMQSHIDNVLVAGDLNTDISRDNSAHTPLLLDFCDRRDLQPCVQLNVNFTYENETTGAKSTLDHFIFNLSLCDSLIDYFCSHDGDNMSDHAPIFLTLDVPSSSVVRMVITRQTDTYLA
ncbi:hypothetical protein CAPTEDRAFT_191605 [Capitella teleta]|uniref:Uncharacterized protein n=1 Tax=Capitella teleta TaxID=283909 RepID=R7UTD4_CAPTE|nr:hypothetical protein CAPTEDRAFT_191605 [Capitella teleta]|eukprot:ELU09774.1 hypothetical protein CAPTEDRAFT_191605 [Capitella teleta]